MLHQGWLTKSPPLETRKQLFNQSLITPVSTSSVLQFSLNVVNIAQWWSHLQTTSRFEYCNNTRRSLDSWSSHGGKSVFPSNQLYLYIRKCIKKNLHQQIQLCFKTSLFFGRTWWAISQNHRVQILDSKRVPILGAGPYRDLFYFLGPYFGCPINCRFMSLVWLPRVPVGPYFVNIWVPF